jgi:acyl-CoA synthetase (AMP-forming)/AMP-acid ligase II/acyl carrier protein
LDSRLSIVDTDSYATLGDAAARVATALERAGVTQGAPVILACPPGLRFVRALYGILRAGAIATPTQPPNDKNALARLRYICADSGALWGVALRETIAEMREMWAPHSLQWIALEDCLAEEPSPSAAMPSSEATAVYQYSSGTVGAPHGVRISHGNLLHNSELIRRSFVHTSKQRGLIWLPPYHDMGLIGGLIQPVYAGFRTTLMAPRTFLRSPLNWLKAVTMTGANTSGGPNFAYELCLGVSDDDIERAGLDLSRWTVAFSGAETVNPVTLKQFGRRFARFGFRTSSFTCCYGLAEATLLVSASTHMQRPTVLAADRESLAAGEVRVAQKAGEADRLLVGHGAPVQTVRIVKPDGTAASAREVGEIWIAGPSVAAPVTLDDRTFDAVLPDDSTNYVQTGDLGFIHNGELYVVGRSKAIVIVRGKNHQAEDIEETCRAIDAGLSKQGAVAFGDDQSGSVIVFEVPKRHDDMPVLLTSIRTAVAQTHGIAVDEIVLVRDRSLPRTPSGKVRRNLVAAAHRTGRLNTLTSWRANGAANSECERTRLPLPVLPSMAGVSHAQAVDLVSDWLAELLAVELHIPKADVDPATHFGVYGLDSLSALNLAMHIGQQYHADLEDTVFWDYPNCQMLAEYLVLGRQTRVEGDSRSTYSGVPA